MDIITEYILPVVKGPSGIKNAPTVIAVAAANLKNQNLQGNQTWNDPIGVLLTGVIDHFGQSILQSDPKNCVVAFFNCLPHYIGVEMQEETSRPLIIYVQIRPHTRYAQKLVDLGCSWPWSWGERTEGRTWPCQSTRGTLPCSPPARRSSHDPLRLGSRFPFLPRKSLESAVKHNFAFSICFF